jgi:hypothetical protein
VALSEGKDVQIVIHEEEASDTMSPEEHARMMERLLAIANKPDGADDDGQGGDKHDQISYGSELT